MAAAAAAAEEASLTARSPDNAHGSSTGSVMGSAPFTAPQGHQPLRSEAEVTGDLRRRLRVGARAPARLLTPLRQVGAGVALPGNYEAL